MFFRAYRMIKSDVRAALERDPAARSPLEIVLAYAGVHAVWGHRMAHWLWNRRLKLLARVVAQLNRFMTGIEIHPGAVIGPGLFIDHGMGVVIGETAEIGENVTLYHGVTLGGVSLEKGKRHPTLEDDVVVGAGAKVLGNIRVGRGSRIGANAVVVKTVPANSVVVGVPGQVMVRSKPAGHTPDLEHGKLPDAIGQSIASILARLEALEKQVPALELMPVGMPGGDNGNGKGNGNGRQPESVVKIHAPDHGLWHGEDFSI